MNRIPPRFGKLGRDVGAGLFIAAVAAIFIHPLTYSHYSELYLRFPATLSFLKFAVLATFGEMLVARMRTGSYLPPQFGLLPKAIVWGFLGVSIWIAFGIFSYGVTGIFFAGSTPENTGMLLLNAFCISFFMNIIFAPMMMMTHHLTDTYIAQNAGKFPLRGFTLLPLLKSIDWERMWGFVYKKTIPFFWIPAHTITFLLPGHARVLFAALLGIVLGVLLAVASLKSQKDC